MILKHVIPHKNNFYPEDTGLKIKDESVDKCFFKEKYPKMQLT